MASVQQISDGFYAISWDHAWMMKVDPLSASIQVEVTDATRVIDSCNIVYNLDQETIVIEAEIVFNKSVAMDGVLIAATKNYGIQQEMTTLKESNKWTTSWPKKEDYYCRIEGSVCFSISKCLSIGLLIYTEAESVRRRNPLFNPFVRDLWKKKRTSNECSVTFNCGAKRFDAHTVVLEPRSPVWNEIFHSAAFKDNKGIPIEIPDIEPETFEDLLRYLYIGEAECLKDDQVAEGAVNSLFRAADEYGIECLKEKCLICQCLAVDNATNFLILAYSPSRRYPSKFRESTMDFVVEKAFAVCSSNGWTEMIKTNPHIAVQVTKDLVTRLVERKSYPESISLASAELKLK